MKVETSNLDHYGRGIARIDGKTVFVNNALPGETVNIEITNTKKNYSEAKVLEYLKESSSRVKPKCPYYEVCGGCDLMHMDYSNQVSFKENKVKEVITKFTDLKPDIIKSIIKSKTKFNYRNKITLHVKNGKVGFYQKDSNDIVEIKKCVVAKDEINEIISVINKELDLEGINEIIIRSNTNTMLIIKGSKDSDYLRSIFKDKVNSLYLNSELLIGNRYNKEMINDLVFFISPYSFFQVNTIQTTNLYNEVIRLSDVNSKTRVLDLYCGTGTIGLSLAKKVDSVVGIESNRQAIKDAKYNAKLNEITNATFICDDSESFTGDYDLIIVDPPRTGLTKTLINKIVDSDIENMIYVSCDPVTLGRDISLLADKYKVIEIVPVDMFANTYHVECVVKLKKLK